MLLTCLEPRARKDYQRRATWINDYLKIYEELADVFAYAKGQVIVAKVDADKHRELGTRFGVQGFPTLKW